MKQSQLVFKSLTVLLCLISIGAYGQKQSKNYSERFTVAGDVVLDINTSHANIEFETWNKDEVAVEATIELEGATQEEAKAYFAKGGIEIMGNSKRVSVSTGSEDSWAVHSFGNWENLNIEIPELPEFESFEMDFDMAHLADLPPVPPTPNPNFDYEAFQKDGEKYLREWQKNFQEDFGEPYQKSMEDWQQKMEAKQKEMQAKRDEIFEKRREAQAEMMKDRVEHAEKRAEAHQKRIEEYHARIHNDSTGPVIIQPSDMKNRPNIFYFNSNDESKNYKVKKTIKIKMPKSTKIKMNVRHGEVKLAGNTKNMNAILNHASLVATVIDGDNTKIIASYSPVRVQYWNYGNLQVDYSDKVELEQVINLHLNASSSDVIIDKLSKSAFIKNNFGPLKIKSISDEFETLDVSLQNAELAFKLPQTAFRVYVNETNSEFVPSDILQLERTAKDGGIVYKGFHTHENSDRSITINSKYSEVVLD